MPATVVETGVVQLDSGPRIDARTDGFDTGERCHAVVRPEKLRIETIGANGAGDGRLPRVEGIVESSIYLGTTTQMVVDLGEEVRMTVLCPNTSEAERQSLPGGGARVSLSWEPEHMHLVRESPAAAADGEKPEDETTSELETTTRG